MLLHNKLKKYKIFLASKSPRRHELLKLLNIDFAVQLFDVEEIVPDHLKNEDVPVYLSQLKAKEAQKKINEHEIVITADTIVILNDKILGKPKDKEHAILMLKTLSANTHIVYTGITVTSKEKQASEVCMTKVYFKALTDEEINYYIDTFKPFDKAGSYGIQEWIGAVGVEKIEGCYYNIMGLPIHLLNKLLLSF